MPNDDSAAAPGSIAEWVTALFDALRDPQALEVTISAGVHGATVECRGATKTLRRRGISSLFATGVFAKMKKLAGLDVAERRRMQRGRFRMRDFHGSPAEFEVTTGRVGRSERLTLRQL